jgi:hypothetical protein
MGATIHVRARKLIKRGTFNLREGAVYELPAGEANRLCKQGVCQRVSLEDARQFEAEWAENAKKQRPARRGKRTPIMTSKPVEAKDAGD